MSDVFDHIRDRLERLPRDSIPTPLVFEFEDGARVRLVRSRDTVMVDRGSTGSATGSASAADLPGIRFRLDAPTTLARLVSGEEDLLDAFMADRIRCDGFLVTAVMLLGAFADRPEAE